MKKRTIKKRFMTLIEVMIVITLIGIISGVLVYNFSGSIDKGKEFATKQRAQQIKHILMLEAVEKTSSLTEIKSEWQKIVGESYLLNQEQKKSICKDGWGKEFKIKIENNEIIVSTPSLKEQQW